MESNPYKELKFQPGEYTKENYEKIDLHRPYVDDVILVSESGKPMKRETDLIDVWFDSGAMPYAQIHYPFENKESSTTARFIRPISSPKASTKHAMVLHFTCDRYDGIR